MDDSQDPKLKVQPEAESLHQPSHFKVKWEQLRNWVKTHPRKAAVIGVAGLVVLGGAGYAAKLYLAKKPVQEAPAVRKKAPEKPKTKPSPLTGLEIAPELADRAVRTVVIENSPEARPQSGLSEAGVVYEGVSEGGITRYMAIFLEGKPAVIGPVRSLRSFFVSWTREFNSPIAHVGGNASAIDIIDSVGIVSLNQFFNGGYYYRSTDRYAPHNVYTTTELLDKILSTRGLLKPATFTPSPRKNDQPPADGTTVPHRTINVSYSFSGFDVRFDYDLAGNDYKRFLAGAPDKDRNNGKQLAVKNVVVVYMPTTYGTSRNGEHMTTMQTVGSGKAIVFRDGTAVVGTWSKASHAARTQLLDAEGKEIKLNRGQTWYCIIPPTGSVTY